MINNDELQISYDDLVNLGIPSSTAIYDLLDILLSYVNTGELENSKGALSERAKEMVRMAI